MKREAYLFRREWLSYMSELDREAQMEVREAVDLYSLDGKAMECMSREARLVFNCIRVDIDRMNQI